MQKLHVKRRVWGGLLVPNERTVNAIHASPTVHTKDSQIQTTLTGVYSIAAGVDAIR